MPARRPGRPSRAAITRDKILDAALEILERDGLGGVSMRALARALEVDPMALYHYFEDRDALLAAAAARAYRGLDADAGTRGTWRERLRSLAVAYVELLATSGELLRYLTTHVAAASVPTELFAARFAQATSALALTPARRRAAHDVFVDFLHGFALAVPRMGLSPSLRRRLHAELDVLLAGIAAR